MGGGRKSSSHFIYSPPGTIPRRMRRKVIERRRRDSIPARVGAKRRPWNPLPTRGRANGPTYRRRCAGLSVLGVVSDRDLALRCAPGQAGMLADLWSSPEYPVRLRRGCLLFLNLRPSAKSADNSLFTSPVRFSRGFVRKPGRSRFRNIAGKPFHRPLVCLPRLRPLLN